MRSTIRPPYFQTSASFDQPRRLNAAQIPSNARQKHLPAGESRVSNPTSRRASATSGIRENLANKSGVNSPGGLRQSSMRSFKGTAGEQAVSRILIIMTRRMKLRIVVKVCLIHCRKVLPLLRLR